MKSKFSKERAGGRLPLRSTCTFSICLASISCTTSSVSRPDSPSMLQTTAEGESKILAACLDGSRAKIELTMSSNTQLISGDLKLPNQNVIFKAHFEIATTEEDDEGISFEGLSGTASSQEVRGPDVAVTPMRSLAFDRISSKGEGLVILQFGKQYIELSSCTFNKKSLALVHGQEQRF